MELQPLDHAFSADDFQYKLEFGPGWTVDADRNAIAPNGAAIRQGDREVSADFGRISKENRIEVRGNVRYQEPRFEVEGDAGSFEGDEAAFEGAKFKLPLLPARGAADDLLLSRSGILQLKNVEYTTCPDGRADWMVKADSLSVDTNKGVGTARDARVEFFGVPILRLPYISFLGWRRAQRAGLLFPEPRQLIEQRRAVFHSVLLQHRPQPGSDPHTHVLHHPWSRRAGEYRFLTRRSRGELSGQCAAGRPQDGPQPQSPEACQHHGAARRLATGHRRGECERRALFRGLCAGRGWRKHRVPAAPDTAFLPDDGSMPASCCAISRTLDQDLPQADQPHTELPRLYARGNWLTQGTLPLNYVSTPSSRCSGTAMPWRGGGSMPRHRSD